MQFKEALRAAGLPKPGRTTWCGVADDGVPVFTIWSQEVHEIDGRLFAWWNHANSKDGESPQRKGRARNFLALATENLHRPCRVVIVHSKVTESGTAEVASAEYPHPEMAQIVFRTVDEEARQFIAELLPDADENVIPTRQKG